MIYEPSVVAVVIFFLFVGLTLGISFYLGSKTRSSQAYFAAHGQIPWFVNGIAFAGDYLSAASFLGICGMIAFYGYDGFLYSIGYLAGWIVALFVVAEPIKRLGKFTFADALNSQFQSRGIKIAAGISTLAVSLFYLIPQMVGAGALVRPLLGFPHWAGVLLVGTTVILIVVTAGMVSTTYVQFIKGALLVFFSLILTVLILSRGFAVREATGDGHVFRTVGPLPRGELPQRIQSLPEFKDSTILPGEGAWKDIPFLRTKEEATGIITVWSIEPIEDATKSSSGDAGDPSQRVILREGQYLTELENGKKIVNGRPLGTEKGEPQLHPIGQVSKLPGGKSETGRLGPLSFFSTLQESEVILWKSRKLTEADGASTTIFYQQPTLGSQVLRPGEHRVFSGIRSPRFQDKLNFLSLMLALFCGTASLPHILIRYYTVKDERSARKSTIVGIGSIGFFYVLTLYLGLGAMTSGELDVTNDNMAAPLLARSMNEWLFAAISAVAFTTVLGTVSGLILASAGAVTHDLLANLLKTELGDHEKVRVAKIASVVVGAIAIVLGILFEKMNVSYLVGWAFSVAASANLPTLVMILYWKGVTKQGVIAAILVGMATSLGWILLSGDTYAGVYGKPASEAIVPFSQPGIVTIPLGFLTLVGVSLLTKAKQEQPA